MSCHPSREHAAMLLAAAFSRHGEALDWARARMEAAWGPVLLQSPLFDFSQTDYYRPTMGEPLKKVFFAFQRPFDPALLAEAKLQAGSWEGQYAALGRHAEPRPLNLDPGYLTLGKLVLASTKDFAHRIYLRDGVFAEITLYFRHGRWECHEWTFPDYRRDDYQAFFHRARLELHRRIRAAQTPGQTEAPGIA